MKVRTFLTFTESIFLGLNSRFFALFAGFHGFSLMVYLDSLCVTAKENGVSGNAFFVYQKIM